MAAARIKKLLVDEKRAVLRINGFEVDLETLSAIIDPNPRLLWAFIKNGRRIQAIPYGEAQVIWLEPCDIDRHDEV